jgi:hypothetical protein
VVLETARSAVFDRVAVYDPAIDVDGSIPAAWLPAYRRLLDSGDDCAAFAHFVKGNGGAPALVSHLTTWYLKAALRVAMRCEHWQRYAGLLDTAYYEHVAGIPLARVAPFPRRHDRAFLCRDHRRTRPFAPDEKAPETVSERLHPLLRLP